MITPSDVLLGKQPNAIDLLEAVADYYSLLSHLFFVRK
jgi:hypothetical protein